MSNYHYHCLIGNKHLRMHLLFHVHLRYDTNIHTIVIASHENSVKRARNATLVQKLTHFQGQSDTNANASQNIAH